MTSAQHSARPGPRNLITDVPGIRVGNAADPVLRSGVTVILPDRPATASGDIRGGGPGTRDTDLLDPANLVEQVHGLCLSGGSAFGLGAADGVMAWLAEQGRGFAVGPALVPIVPSAILFDLNNGGDKGWGRFPPYRELAYQACQTAGVDFPLGNVGAGYGAKAGALKGGLGSASLFLPEGDAGTMVGALVAANPVGAVTLPDLDVFWAWPFEIDGEFGGHRPPPDYIPPPPDSLAGTALPQLRGNTTLAVVATDAALTKAEARRLAIMAQDGLAQAIRPVHTPFDGDSVFVLATGEADPKGVGPERLLRLGMAAAGCVARAVARGVYEAESLGPFPAFRSRKKSV